MLQDLRSMLCWQRFEALARAVKCHFREGDDEQVLSLPALTHVHSGSRGKALELLKQKTWLDAFAARNALLH